MGRIDHGYPVAEAREFRGAMARDHGHGHAVNVAGRRRVGRVEIGMGIEPQDEQRPVPLGAIARDGGDGPNADAVIPAEKDGELTVFDGLVDRVMDRPAPVHDLVEMAITVFGVVLGVDRSRQVALINDIETKAPQRLG